MKTFTAGIYIYERQFRFKERLHIKKAIEIETTKEK